MRKTMTLLAAALLLAGSPAAQNRSEDEYTRYELLAPDTSSFRIIYDVSAVSPGAKYFFNPIRVGSEASDESVIDLASGRFRSAAEILSADKLARLAGRPVLTLAASTAAEAGAMIAAYLRTRHPRHLQVRCGTTMTAFHIFTVQLHEVAP